MSKYFNSHPQWSRFKNKATLGMLVAITAFKKGNEVKIFLVQMEHIY